MDVVAAKAVPDDERLSPEAFAEAFVAHARSLWCIAAAVLGSHHLVEDVLQEGAVIALRKLDQFRAGTSFVAWMGCIVQYVALNHARRRRRLPVTMGEHDDLPGGPPPVPGTTPSGLGELPVDQIAFDDEVMAALDGLSADARSCLLLRTLLDMPYREIALALDMPEGTAMSHVHRARRLLRERLHHRDPALVKDDVR